MLCLEVLVLMYKRKTLKQAVLKLDVTFEWQLYESLHLPQLKVYCQWSSLTMGLYNRSAQLCQLSWIMQKSGK